MEKGMFPMIKTYLIDQGYDVKAEIMHADIVAKKDDVVTIIEMKTSLSTKLIYQGLKRMHISDLVYLAIPKPTSRILKSHSFLEKKTIVRRLELGLILVDLKKEMIDILFDPIPYQFKKQHKKKKRLLKEFNLRQTALNTGGVTRTKIMTAYRELALLVVALLNDGPQTTTYLKERTSRHKVTDILQKNYYGWFERVSRGVYQLTPEGKQAIKIYDSALKDILSHQDIKV